jgi:ABC-2 type transport system ATP-binding protein
MTTILADNLIKRFGNLTAVGGLHLSVNNGEIFGFLGPNGAGKTTTMRMLTGVLIPDSGTVFINGIDICHHPLDAKMQMGVIPESSTVYGDLTAVQNLHLSGKMYGMPRALRNQRINELLMQLNLTGKKDQLVRTFSKGLRQRVSIGCAIIHHPSVLFLDEPTSGLDVQSRRLVIEIIRQMNEQGVTIFLTTHNLDEASTLCHRICIINNGRIIAEETPEKLKEMGETSRSVEVSFNQDVNPDQIPLESVLRITSCGDKVRLYTRDPDRVLKNIVNFADDHAIRITSLSTLGPSLEDTYLHLTECDA